MADVLAGFTMDSEVIVILDGALAGPPLPTDPRLTTITLAHSIGQRAATNLGARISQARHVMKLDAHCRVKPGFDAALIGHCGPTDTLVPRMYNLQAFVWVCPACDYHIDQGPPPAKCERKGCLNTTGFTRDDVWDIKWGRKTDSMCFDSDLKFKYWGEYPLREVLAAFHHATGETPTTYPPIMKMEWSAYQQLADAEKLPHRLAALMLLAQVYNDWKRTDSKRVLHQLEALADHEEVSESMSLLGAAWLMQRSRYWEIGGLDEAHGSWGQMGTEIACKSWLSGGRVLVDRTTWFAHLFRTRDGFSWPYLLPNSDQERARAYSRDLWANNKWPGQVHPLLWLVEHFAPAPTWSDAVIQRYREAASGTAPGGVQANATPTPVPARVRSPAIPRLPFALAPVPPRLTIAAELAELEAREKERTSHVQETATKPVGNHAPSAVGYTCPNDGPGVERVVSGDHLPNSQVARDDKAKTVSVGVVYYTDNVIDPALANAVWRNLTTTLAATRTPPALVSVSLGAPSPASDLIQSVILAGKRGVLTMFRQILAGLEASTAEVVFFAEHDVLYAPGYFDFRPPDPEKVWYNLNIWNLRLADGRCVYWDAKRTSQLCAYRTTLLDHYRKRVARVEAEGRWSQAIGFEPGSHGRVERIDDLQSATWQARYPSVDIKHDRNLTPSRWRQDQFRSPRSCRNWQEGEEIPYWGNGRELAQSLQSVEREAVR